MFNQEFHYVKFSLNKSKQIEYKDMMFDVFSVE